MSRQNLFPPVQPGSNNIITLSLGMQLSKMDTARDSWNFESRQQIALPTKNRIQLYNTRVMRSTCGTKKVYSTRIQKCISTSRLLLGIEMNRRDTQGQRGENGSYYFNSECNATIEI